MIMMNNNNNNDNDNYYINHDNIYYDNDNDIENISFIKIIKKIISDDQNKNNLVHFKLPLVWREIFAPEC